MAKSCGATQPGADRFSYPSIHDFVANHPEFSIDPFWTRYGITSSPDGWLKKRPASEGTTV